MSYLIVKATPTPKHWCHSSSNACLQYKQTCLQQGGPLTKRKSSPRQFVVAGLLDGLFGGSKSPKTCKKCQNKGAIACPGCKGTGRNRQNGNMFERWKCYDCQGFGQITCPQCGGGLGLTPEQRRER